MSYRKPSVKLLNLKLKLQAQASAVKQQAQTLLDKFKHNDPPVPEQVLCQLIIDFTDLAKTAAEFMGEMHSIEDEYETWRKRTDALLLTK